jgi:hypothetical protein
MVSPRPDSWLSAILAAARRKGIELPTVKGREMGILVCQGPPPHPTRSVVVRRRLVPRDQAASQGVEWILLDETVGSSNPIALFHEGTELTDDRAEFIVELWKGWLLDDWKHEVVRQLTQEHSLDQPRTP